MSDDGLQQQKKRMIEAVKAAGGAAEAVNRRAIATALGKRQLNGADMILLDVLAEQGTIERTQRKNNSPVGWEWVYQVKAKGVQR